MTHDQIRKLLGGYATNTLTEDERRALMEAALNDQELFNALQDEEALRELLADAHSRQQIYQALTQRPAAPWWRRSWMWGGVLAAAAAAALIVAVIQRQPTQTALQQVQIAQNKEPANTVARQQPPAVIPKAVASAAKKRAFERAQAPIAAPPPAAASSQPTAPAPQVAAEARPQASVGAVGGFVAGAGAARDATALSILKSAPIAPLRYTILRRSADGTFSPMPLGQKPMPGDAIRLSITSAIAGELTVYRAADSGNLTSLAPATTVQANISYTVPESAIEVTNDDRRLRIVLENNAGAPLSLDIPIGAN